MAWKHPAKYEVTTENDYDGYPVYTLWETSKKSGPNWNGKWVRQPIGKLEPFPQFAFYMAGTASGRGQTKNYGMTWQGDGYPQRRVHLFGGPLDYSLYPGQCLDTDKRYEAMRWMVDQFGVNSREGSRPDHNEQLEFEHQIHQPDPTAPHCQVCRFREGGYTTRCERKLFNGDTCSRKATRWEHSKHLCTYHSR